MACGRTSRAGARAVSARVRRRRFQCNVCGMLTDVPMDYYCATDANGVRHDLEQHPELTSGSVEYLAPTEYMVRGEGGPSPKQAPHAAPRNAGESVDGRHWQ